MGIDGMHALYHIYDEVQTMTEESQNHHDDEDVPAVLERVTTDGPSEDNFNPDELPESDFVAFATDDVEQTEEDPK